MDRPRYQSIELRLAESGQELAAAIGAAQYARLVDHEPPADPAEAAAIRGFIEQFATAAERWHELGPADRAGLLARLGDHLEALERHGWFVHWATLGFGLKPRRGGDVQLPLAILRVGRSGQPTLRVRIPGALTLDPGSGALH